MGALEKDVHSIKDDVKTINDMVGDLEEDVQSIKADVKATNEDVQSIKSMMTRIVKLLETSGDVEEEAGDGTTN